MADDLVNSSNYIRVATIEVKFKNPVNVGDFEKICKNQKISRRQTFNRCRQD